MMNEFWTFLGLSVDDLVYTQAPKYLCELGDATEFIEYGEEQCIQLGIEDDAEMADFLFQAFEGKVRSWYMSLPEDVRTSWFALKIALQEEFGEGGVMEAMRLLCKVWWQIPNFEVFFKKMWKVYEQVSFFRYDFLKILKVRVLDKLDYAHVELAKIQSMQGLEIKANVALVSSLFLLLFDWSLSFLFG